MALRQIKLDSSEEVRVWQIAKIKEAIRQADAGMLVPHEEVVKEWMQKANADSLDNRRKKRFK